MTFARPEAYRQSLIATADSCMLRALFSLEDERRTPGHMATRGTLTHRVFHKAVRIMWANGERRFSVEQGMELLLATLAQMAPEVESGDVLPLPMREMKWCRTIVAKWCETTTLDARRVLATEERLSAPVELPTGKTVDVTGQIDLIIADPPNGLTIVDWKTGFRRPKAQKMGGDPQRMAKAESEGIGLTELGWVQWLVYSYLCFANFPSIERVTFRERHVLWNEERYAKMERWESERMADPLKAQVALLDQAVDEGPSSKRWVPSGGPHCALCSRPWSCPILDLERINVHTEEGRRRVAHEWIVATETRDRRRDILNGLVDVYGPIEVPHSDGRRVVGWEVDPNGKRRFGIFEPPDVPTSPYDDALAEAARSAGVLQE